MLKPLACPAGADAGEVRAYVQQRYGALIYEDINPGVLARDAAGESIPASAFLSAARLGMTGFGLPTDIGGSGHDVVTWGRMLEEIGYASQDSCLPFVVSLRASVIRSIFKTGKDHLIDTYAIPMVYGTRSPAFAYTDGTDAFSFKTEAKRVGGDYVLNGEKHYVTGGETADTFMVYARRADSQTNDLQVFLVEREDAGVTVHKSDLSGLRSAGIARLELNQVRIPAIRAVALTDGLSHVQGFLNERRVYLACPILGRMQAILEDTIQELGGKVRYGSPLTAMQNVQAELGRMYTRIETARSMLYRALERQASPAFDPYWDAIGCVAKSFVVDQALALCASAQRLLGGDGFLRNRHLERYARDFAGYIPGGGSQDTLTVDLGVHAIAAAQSVSPAL